MMPWRTHIAVFAVAAICAAPGVAQDAATTVPDTYLETTALHQEIDGLRAQVRDLTGYLAGAQSQHRSDEAYQQVLESRLAVLQHRVDRQRLTIKRLRAVTPADVFGAVAMVMTPGGHGQVGPRGWLTVESGTTAAGSAAMRVRTGLRGWRVRVWEDGSMRIWYHGHALFTACITGKGCED